MTTLTMTKVPSRAPSGTASWLQRGWRLCLMLVLLVASLGVTHMAVAQADPDREMTTAAPASRRISGAKYAVARRDRTTVTPGTRVTTT
ncbi:hypothetical protein HAALTHF_16540n [Vreelandella aquamarina]|nr:hypothetical protein HAALTHF_16540n [Halomonas axialensis]